MYYIFAPSTAFLLVRNEYTSPEQKSNRTRDGSNSLDDIPTQACILFSEVGGKYYTEMPQTLRWRWNLKRVEFAMFIRKFSTSLVLDLFLKMQSTILSKI